MDRIVQTIPEWLDSLGDIVLSVSPPYIFRLCGNLTQFRIRNIVAVMLLLIFFPHFLVFSLRVCENEICCFWFWVRLKAWKWDLHLAWRTRMEL